MCHLYKRASVWGWSPSGFNPAKDVVRLRVRRKEPSVWSADDLRSCLQCYQRQLHGKPSTRIAILALGPFAGLLLSEIEGVAGERDGLSWEDIDFKRRHIHIRLEAARKLAELRYITFTAKPESGLSEDPAAEIWNAMASWLLPELKLIGPVAGRKSQGDINRELRDA